MENGIEFNCPYCGEMNYTDVFFSEGKFQSFIHDCEVCCRPIEINANIDGDGNINFEVKNGEGF